MESIAGSCCLIVFIIIAALVPAAGTLGATISSGIEWGKIRYDYPYKENNNNTAYTLYYLVMMCWILPVVAFVIGLLEQLFVKFELTGIVKILGFVAGLVSLGFLGCMSAAIDFSKDSRCNTIRRVGTGYGQNTTDFIDYVKGETEGMSKQEAAEWMADFDKDRCEGYHTLMIIFISLFCGGIALVFLVACCGACCSACCGDFDASA